jgi:hypothetical protein
VSVSHQIARKLISDTPKQTTAASYPQGSPIYEGVIGAYDQVMKILLIAATCIAVIPPLLALGINNILL